MFRGLPSLEWLGQFAYWLHSDAMRNGTSRAEAAVQRMLYRNGTENDNADAGISEGGIGSG